MQACKTRLTQTFTPLSAFCVHFTGAYASWYLLHEYLRRFAFTGTSMWMTLRQEIGYHSHMKHTYVHTNIIHGRHAVSINQAVTRWGSDDGCWYLLRLAVSISSTSVLPTVPASARAQQVEARQRVSHLSFKNSTSVVQRVTLAETALTTSKCTVGGSASVCACALMGERRR